MTHANDDGSRTLEELKRLLEAAWEQRTISKHAGDEEISFVMTFRDPVRGGGASDLFAMAHATQV